MATLSLRSPARKYGAAVAVIVAVPLAVVGYRLVSRSPPTTVALPRRAPHVRMELEISSSTPGAKVKIAGEPHALPYSGEVEGGTAPVVIELTAPAHEGRTFRVVFDRPRRLGFALPVGDGAREATPEELERALAGEATGDVLVTRPTNAATPSTSATAAKPIASVAPSTSAVAAVTASAEILARVPSATAAALLATQAPTAEPPAATAKLTAAPPTAPAPPPGTIDPKAVRATVRAHAPEVQTCFDRAKLDVPDLHGRVTVDANVNAAGRVQFARISQSDVRSARLEACILGAFQSWTFPAPSGGVHGTVKYTFVFQD